jgi:hypothetical protein
LLAKVLGKVYAAWGTLSRSDGEYFKGQLNKISIDPPEHGNVAHYDHYFLHRDNYLRSTTTSSYFSAANTILSCAILLTVCIHLGTEDLAWSEVAMRADDALRAMAISSRNNA